MHNRARIIEALSDAIGAIEGIESVTLGAANLKSPVRGVTVDVSLNKETSERTVGDKPNEGVLQRILEVALTLESGSADRTAVEFEDQILAPLETAVSTCEALAPLADDWYVAETHYDYAQDRRSESILSVVIVRIFYSTHPAQPAMAL